MRYHRIMYVCSDCSDSLPESCGFYDRNDLRVIPDGRWLCEGCFDDTDWKDRGEDPEAETSKLWADFPAPPEYAPLLQNDRQK
jgi:hypothetical protein